VSEMEATLLILAAFASPVAFFWLREWWLFEQSMLRKRAGHGK